MKNWIMILCLTLGLSVARAQEEAPVAEGTTPETADVTATESAEPAAEAVAEEPAESAPAAEPEAPAPAAKFAVIMPERIDHDWYWILYSDTSQHLVQSAIEKSLIRAGAEVIDLSSVELPSFGNDWMRLASRDYAVKVGRQIGVDYIITGQATSVKASEGNAYGVTVYRSQAEISAKIVRVSDGKIIEVFDESGLEGGQSAQAAGQTALKKLGGKIGGKIGRAAMNLPAVPKAP